MSRAIDQAKQRISDIHDRCLFGKHVVRTEPCDRSTSYRRKVKHDGSRARRRLDRAVVQEELAGA